MRGWKPRERGSLGSKVTPRLMDLASMPRSWAHCFNSCSALCIPSRVPRPSMQMTEKKDLMNLTRTSKASAKGRTDGSAVETPPLAELTFEEVNSFTVTDSFSLAALREEVTTSWLRERNMSNPTHTICWSSSEYTPPLRMVSRMNSTALTMAVENARR